jgi:hypothetical protein
MQFSLATVLSVLTTASTTWATTLPAQSAIAKRQLDTSPEACRARNFVSVLVCDREDFGLPNINPVGSGDCAFFSTDDGDDGCTLALTDFSPTEDVDRRNSNLALDTCFVLGEMNDRVSEISFFLYSVFRVGQGNDADCRGHIDHVV